MFNQYPKTQTQPGASSTTQNAPVKITRRGVPMTISGVLPPVGTPINLELLQNLARADWTLFDPRILEGKPYVLDILPSADTPTCAKTIKAFENQFSQKDEGETKGEILVFSVSKDLPPALNRFCTVEGIKHVVPLSAYLPECEFGTQFGVSITDGSPETKAFKGLFARAVIAVSASGNVVYSELVAELANEPNYEACGQALVESMRKRKGFSLSAGNFTE